MRGDTRPVSAATIFNAEGKALFYVVPPKLMFYGLAGLALLLAIAVVLGFLVISNRWDIDRLKEKNAVEESTN